MIRAPATMQRVRSLAHLDPGLDPGLIAVIAIFVLFLPFSTPRIYASDEVQYYVYIRSLYFDGDLNFQNEYDYFATRGEQHGDPAVYNALLRDNPDDPPLNPTTGLLRNVAPVGAALLWSPGFVAADLLVRVGNLFGAEIPADGYARPYIWSVCSMSALYTLLGLLLTYRLTRHFVGAFSAALATCTVFLATPLFFYTYVVMPVAYAPGFFLFALFLTIWLWEADDKPLAERLSQRSLQHWALLGLVAGLMTITREQLGFMLIMPAIEGIIAYGRLLQAGNQVQRIGRLLAGHCLFLACLVLALSPQLLTYQVLNGLPLPSSTVSGKLESTGGFSPNFFNTLIHPAHGAFLWSPVLPFGLLGLFWLARRDWLLAVLLALGFIGQTYINGAFGSTWHLSGAFGFRRLIEITPIFVLGLACLLAWLQPRTGRWPLLVCALFLVYWNIALVAQWAVVRPEMRSGLIWDSMLSYQFVEVPRQVSEKFFDLLFNRCRLVQNQDC